MAAAPGINLCTYSADLSDTGSLAHLLSSLPILTRLTSQPFVSLNAIGNCIRAVQMCFIGFLGTLGLRICFVSKYHVVLRDRIISSDFVFTVSPKPEK